MSEFSVLFVDDEKNILNSLKRKMRTEKFNSFYANSGFEALDILEFEEDICVVVTDLRMPEMDGIQLSQKINEMNPKIPIIVLTAYHQVSTILVAINSGLVKQYLRKPIKVKEELLPSIYQEYDDYTKSIDADNLVKNLKSKNEILENRINEIENSIHKKEESTTSFLNSLASFLKQVSTQTETLPKFSDEQLIKFSEILNKNIQTIIKKIDSIKDDIQKD